LWLHARRALGYRRIVRRTPSVDEGPARLTLGGLHRALRDAVGRRRDKRITVHFEQRSAISPQSGEPGRDPDLLVVRRFEARFDVMGAAVEGAELLSAGLSTQPHCRVLLLKSDAGYLYSVDGVHYGRFEGRPELFDLARFEQRLDEVNVQDATVEQVSREHAHIMVVDMDVDVDSFRNLQSVFAGGIGADAEGLDLRSYTVALSAADDVALDYWWSLIGHEVERDDTYRHTVACHVQITVGPMVEPYVASQAFVFDATLPTLRHIDELWGLARSGAQPASLSAEAGVPALAL
jgi:hypothetical protein